MAKGKTLSITIPNPVVDYYDQQAEKLQMSRGAVIRKVLIEDFAVKTKHQSKEEMDVITDKPSS